MPLSAKIAAIGNGTQKALEERGLFADLVPEVFDGQHLGEALSRACQGSDKILIPRAKLGNRELIQELEKKEGLIIHDIATYDTFYERQEAIDESKEFDAGTIDCAVFTSASTVRGFAAATPGLDYKKVRAACIGRQTKAEADALGMETYMSSCARIDSLVQLVIELKEKDQKN